MPKKAEIAIITPRAAMTQANRVVQIDSFERLSFWEELSQKEKDSLVDEGTQIRGMMLIKGVSELKLGEHIKKVHDLLIVHQGAFEKFLRSFTTFSRRTGYRYMQMYEDAAGHFSDDVIQAAAALGMNIPGKYAKAIELLPPPHNLHGDKAVEYLEKVRQKRREIQAAVKEGTMEAPEPATVAEIRRDPNVMLMTSYRITKNSMRTLTKAKRDRFVKSLIGMIMTEAGYASATTFEPEAIPEEFRQGRGRPRLSAAS